MKQAQVDSIERNLNKRMAEYNHSMQPTDDEVSIALLLCHIQDLEKTIEDLTKNEFVNYDKYIDCEGEG